jgi:hypothetical protein
MDNVTGNRPEGAFVVSGDDVFLLSITVENRIQQLRRD